MCQVILTISKDIRYWVGKVLTPEQSEVEKKPEPKHSLKERLLYCELCKKVTLNNITV